jgi:DnaJ-class molecular chaperone
LDDFGAGPVAGLVKDQAECRGMPDVGGRGRGDLLVAVRVTTPKKLTKEQKKLLEQLAQTMPKEEFVPPTARTQYVACPTRPEFQAPL